MDRFEELKMNSLRARMRLEVLGMKFRGRPVTAMIREKYGITARRKSEVLSAFEQIMVAKGLIRT
jgi:hypothetical protein